MATHYTYAHNGKKRDHHFMTKGHAEKAARMHCDDGITQIIGFKYHPDTGERYIVSQYDYKLHSMEGIL